MTAAAKGSRGTSSKVAGRRRRAAAHAEGEEGGSERWLVTYADMLTLLLVLFIVLFSISVVNTSKFISLKTSLATAFGTGQASILDGANGLLETSAEGHGQTLVNPGVPFDGTAKTEQTVSQNPTAGPAGPAGPPTTVPTATPDYAAQARSEAARLKAIEKAVSAALRREGMTGSARFSIDRRGLIITVVTNQLVFPGNSAQLLPRGEKILAVIAPQLVRRPNNIEVDGFTNQVKVSTFPYPSGWELSSARASAVVRFLIGHGVAESRLSAVGFSDQRPLYPASDPRSVTLNRRVEIVVLTTLSPDAAALLPTVAH